MNYKIHLNFFLQPKVVAAFVAFLIMTIVIVFIPVGVANNGELDRIMLENNLYSLQTESADNYFSYFVKDYGVSEYYNDYIDKTGSFSTQKIFIRVAVAVDRIFTDDNGIFDVRFFGFLQVLICTFAIYLFVDYLTYGKKPLTGYVIAALVVLVLADTGYVAYFNSFYPNGIEYVSFLIAITSIFMIKQARYNRYILALLFCVSSFVFLFARTRNAWAGIILAVLSLLLMTERKDKNYSKDKIFNKVLISISVFLFISSFTAFFVTTQSIENIHKYNAMSRGALKTSQDMESTLDDLNVYRQFSLLHNTTFYDKYPIAFVDSEEFSVDFYDRVDFVSLASYYARNPAQFYEMLKFSLENAYTIRPQSTGNFLKESGQPEGEKTSFFTVYSTIKDEMIPRTIGVFYVWLALLYFFYIRSEYNVKIMTAITLIGVSQIFIAIIGSGDADMTRNMFMFGLVFDFLNLLMLSSVLNVYINEIYTKKAKPRVQQKKLSEKIEIDKTARGESTLTELR